MREGIAPRSGANPTGRGRSKIHRAKKLVCGGIHSAILTETGFVYSFGCGSDGRLGHPEYVGHTYLYKESRPKLIESLQNVDDLESSYYHMIALIKE